MHTKDIQLAHLTFILARSQASHSDTALMYSDSSITTDAIRKMGLFRIEYHQMSITPGTFTIIDNKESIPNVTKAALIPSMLTAGIRILFFR